MLSFKIVVLAFYLLFIAQSKEKIIKSGANNAPNILFIMVDDLGWGNVAWPGHNTHNSEINTPNIDALVANGLQLHRQYVSSGCSPTRASFQTGRLPVHVTETNDDGLEDPTHGIPTEMTTFASKLKQAGYNTHLVGKWDNGFSSFAKLPLSKGYDTFYGYLDKSVTYFSKLGDNDCGGVDFVDLWENNAPAHTSIHEVDTDTYLEFLFMDRVTDIIDTYHQTNDPFFLLYSMHLPHYPCEIPRDHLETFAEDENECQNNNEYIYPGFTDGDLFQCRSTLQSQVNLMDLIIGKVIDRLKQNHLYDTTLIVFSTDNGGSLELDDTAGNNYPLRGGKGNFFEGGIRASAFVSGGFLPQSRRGKVETGLMHVCDWFATFCGLAGIDASDEMAVAAGLPEVDAMDMWPLLSGQVSHSPRAELIIAKYALIQGDYKFLIAKQKYAIWQGVTFPNSSSADQDRYEDTYLDCQMKGGCLFDVANDPSEYVDLSESMPQLASAMNDRLHQLSEHFYENKRVGTDSCPTESELYDSETLSCGCWMAINNYNYFAGPYQDLTMQQMAFVASEDGSRVLDKFENQTKDNITENNYSVYLGLGVMLFIGIVIVSMKHNCKSRDNTLNDAERKSYGAA